MIVVADTSPLNYLAVIHQTNLLHQLFGSVVVPRAVARELAVEAAPAEARRLVKTPPSWLVIRAPQSIDPTLPRLGEGETEAICLAIELGADLLLCDD